MKRYLKVVYVEWIDSQTHQGWQGEPEEPEPCISTGLLVNEGSFIVLAHSYDRENDEWNGLISIPSPSIKKIRTLCQIQMKSK